MNSLPAEPVSWPRRRWLGMLILIFVLQLALIFGLSEHGTARPRRARPSLSLQMVSDPPPELVALTDPTLFALPHRQTFAGLAWLKVPRLEFRTIDFSQPTNWLALNAARLGVTFNEFTETNAFRALPVPMLPEVELAQPYFAGISNPRSGSTWRLEGDLAHRKITSPLPLPSWPNNELLTNTVVQVVIDRAGRLVSVPLLLASSTVAGADDYALDQARAVRFEPINPQDPAYAKNGMSWGQIVFEWNTMPVPPSNAPAAQPP